MYFDDIAGYVAVDAAESGRDAPDRAALAELLEVAFFSVFRVKKALLFDVRY